MMLKAILFFLFLLFQLDFAERKQLNVGVLLEQTKHWYGPYTGFFPTIFDYVFQQVENRSDILDGYEFNLVVQDTQGKPGLAARKLFQMLDKEKPKVAIIGPTLSDSLTVTGQIVPYYNVVELSYIATTATTAKRDLYSTLFKVNQVTDALNLVRIEMMKYFGWKRVATIAFQNEFSVSQIDDFHTLLGKNNMTLVASAVISETSNINDVLKSFKQFGVRIIMGALTGKSAPRVFCEAFYQNMYGDSHVWILSGSPMFDGWIDYYTEKTMGCKREEIIQATQGHFTLHHEKESQSVEPTISGHTPEEIRKDLQSMVSETPYKLSNFASWIYDTPWVLAIGLNNSVKYLEEAGLSLHEFNYSSAYLDAIMKGMRETQFEGLSGPVAFTENGFRVGVNFIQQNFYDQHKKVASFDEMNDNLTLLVDTRSLWLGQEVPHDSFIYQDVLVAPSKIAFSIVVSLDCCGYILSFVFLFFNIYYRNNRSIKMSSPMVNNVIIVGCILIYTELLTNSINYYRNRVDSVGNELCMIRIWLLSIGFTSLFGALFSKTYRVYVVFRDYKLKRKAIKDYHLFGMIAVMLVIDLIILIPWTATCPLKKLKVTSNNRDVLNNNMIYSESYLHCVNDYSTYWIAAIYVYKGLLLAFGTFLAWETRQVTVPGLNDSKYIGACIYNVVIVCMFGVPLTHVLPVDQMTLNFVLQSSLLFFCTTMCQCIIFIPKISMRNQVHGKFLTSGVQLEANLSTGKPSGVHLDARGSNQTCSDRASHEDLKEENTKLRMAIAHETIAIAKLRRTLLQMTGSIHFYKMGTEYVICQNHGLRSDEHGSKADNKCNEAIS